MRPPIPPPSISPAPSPRPVNPIETRIGQMIDGILKREGDFVDHPSDPGGATRWGITQRVARANGYLGDMRDLPIARARMIYYHQYIVKAGLLPLVETDPVIAEEIIDSGVNAGPARAAKWFQQALNILNRRGRDYPDILEDGNIGPGTLSAWRAFQEKRGAAAARRLMIRALDGMQFMHYYALARADGKFEDFMPGWVEGRIGNAREA